MFAYKISGLWVAESCVEVVLALNRCLFFAAPDLALCLFGSNEFGTGYRAWLWMVPPTLWGSWYFLYGTPTIFSFIDHFETWNPHNGYHDEMRDYVSFFKQCSMHNLSNLSEKKIRKEFFMPGM